MSLYSGKKCVSCGEELLDSDDVVVCPDCGAPHHRACYNRTNSCAQANLHNTDEEWCKKNSPNMVVFKTCPKCGAKNNISSVNCSACGTNFNTSAKKAESDKQLSFEEGIKDPDKFIVYGTMNENEELEGISAKEWVAFVGKTSYFYLTKFKMMAEGGNFSWNGGAFFLSFLYFFYRKLYKQGVALLLMFAITLIPSFVLMGHYAQFIPAESIMGEQIVLPDPNEIIEKMTNPETNPNVDSFLLWIKISNLMTYARFALAIAVGFTANKLYMNHCVKKIKYTRAALPDFKDNPNYFNSLSLIGGVSLQSSVFVAIGASLLGFAISFLQISAYMPL
ncbi:MAG: RING finger protein [Oscillospiraceae bacterium]